MTYTYQPDDNLFTRIPTVSYSDTELYLGFENNLQITSNLNDGETIKFNLPAINNHSFIAPISYMINISTTEVAIFFVNNIIICSKVQDELLTYRYDYYNTKLSTGIRYGDMVMNTLEGSYTIFPTKRGLAFMNYQSFMATTDQVLNYVTDLIRDLWDDFYDKSSKIKMIQHNSYLMLTNGTNEILLFDVNKMTWWKWEVPFNITSLTSDQLKLGLISDKLYVFDKSDVYRDFPKTDYATDIDWYIQS